MTLEEVVTRDYILNEKPDGIINIIDATNIERNMLLTMQLIELDVPMVIALNMMDEVNESGGSIDVNGLEAALGVPVIPISASKNQGIEELVEHALNVAKYEEHPGRLDFCAADDGGYWINATSAVPEPAAFAVAIGTVALAFAALRRRK